MGDQVAKTSSLGFARSAFPESVSWFLPPQFKLSLKPDRKRSAVIPTHHPAGTMIQLELMQVDKCRGLVQMQVAPSVQAGFNSAEAGNGKQIYDNF
jgi:hypothetical protein